MSVLIKGMKMPTNCFDCSYRFDTPGGAYCITLDKDFEEGVDIYETSRPEWCPLVEVKANHGNLIDQNQILKDIQFCIEMTAFGEDYGDEIIKEEHRLLKAVLEYISEQPAAIEAEEIK